MSSASRKSTAREYFESIVIAVILALFIRTWVVQAFKIPTGSMEHNLLIGSTCWSTSSSSARPPAPPSAGCSRPAAWRAAT